MKRKYLFIHCTATKPQGVDGFTADTLIRMHTAPVSKGGRGWKRVGYAALILGDGRVARFYNDDGDGFVDSDEITNGAAGYNSVSRHICYVGGLDLAGKAFRTLTYHQEETLIREIESALIENPDILILGHNQVSNKSCPSFSVVKWLEFLISTNAVVGLTEGNICRTDVFGHAARLSM